jgi:hypothetical protein
VGNQSQPTSSLYRAISVERKGMRMASCYPQQDLRSHFRYALTADRPQALRYSCLLVHLPEDHDMWSPISTTAEDYGASAGDMNPVWQAILPPSLCFQTIDRARVLFKLRPSQSQRRLSRATTDSYRTERQGMGHLEPSSPVMINAKVEGGER